MYSSIYLDFITSFPVEQQAEAGFWFFFAHLLLLAICLVIGFLKEEF